MTFPCCDDIVMLRRMMILLEILETRSRHFETVEGSNTYLEVVESEKLSNIYCVGSVSREREVKRREREKKKRREVKKKVGC
jgi:hypothetical protein